ncbi:hypothetical protein NX059_003736 [Plenodomus lindquistii]|nr:hypothetical protein NX059_003736 [Plenodomus lindquistii]
MDLNASIHSMTDAMWERCISINLTAPMNLMRAVIPYMREQKSGSIFNVASKAGLSGAVAGVAYTASEHGLIDASKNVAWRYRTEGIRCNVVAPGGVATGITGSIDMSKFDLEAMETMKPIH